MIIKKELVDDETSDEVITREELEIMPSEEDELDNAALDVGYGEGSVDTGTSQQTEMCEERQEFHINGGLEMTKEPILPRDAPKVPLLECQYCETWYLSADTFRHHSELHHTHNLDTIYNCRQCLRGFCTKEQQHVHERNHSGAKPYKCEVCHEQFSFLRSLEYHVQLHGGVRVYKCQICDKIFLQLFELNMHLKYHATLDHHSSTQPYTSFIANGMGSSAVAWKRQVDGSQSTSRNISDPGNLLKPIEMLTTEERVKREEQSQLIEIYEEGNSHECNDENNSEENMRDLISRNTGTSSSLEESKFSCNRCGLDFKYFRLLQLHKKTRKGVRCPECSQKFCSSKLLDDHLSVHAIEQERLVKNQGEGTAQAVRILQTQAQSHLCLICNRELKIPNEQNIMNFQGETYYKCNDCINVSLNTTVKREMIEDSLFRVYEGHGVFTKDDTDENVTQDEEGADIKSEASNDGHTCTHCKINFNGDFALKAHRRKTVERNCPKCAMPFCNIKLLRRHMRDHERDENEVTLNFPNFPPPITRNMSKSLERINQPYEHFNREKEISSKMEIKKVIEERLSCPKCGKVVTGKGALAAHMAHTHKEKTTICPHCGKAFAFTKILNMHLAYRQRASFPVGCRFCPHRYRNQAEVDAHELFHKRTGAQRRGIATSMTERSILENQLLSPTKSEETHEIARSDGNILIIRRKKIRGIENPIPVMMQDDKYFQGLYTEKNGVFYCKQCPNYYRTRGALKAHIFHSHRDKPFTCKFCGMPFPFEKMLEFHLKRRKDLKCDVCSDRFCSYGKLEEHVKKHQPGQVNKTNEALIKKVMQNSEIEIALVGQERKPAVKQEIPKKLISVPPPPVVEQKCPLCEKVMGKRDVLNDHIATHLKRVGEYFRCKDCDLKYLYPIYLVRHYKNRKVSNCELCQKVFCSEINKINHECAGQSLKRLRSLSPSSEEEILPKRASRVNGIEGRLTNTSAAQRGSNITHDWLAMLDNIMPCKCNFCGRVYGKPGGLGQHLSTMHAVDTFPCKLCNAAFSSLPSLIRHKNGSCEGASTNCVTTIEQNDRQIKNAIEETTSVLTEEPRTPSQQPEASKEYEGVPEIVHVAKKSTQCPVCFEKFEHRCGLSAHLRLKHKDARPYECEECGRCFQYEKALEVHRKYHDIDPPTRRRRRRGRRNALQDSDLSTMEFKEESLENDAKDMSGNAPNETIDMDIDEELTPGFDLAAHSVEEQVSRQ